MTLRLRPVAAAALLLSLAALPGCAHLGAEPWERDVLARPDMQLDPHPLQTALDSHMYFSKEASSGGQSFAGGGCGCN